MNHTARKVLSISINFEDRKKVKKTFTSLKFPKLNVIAENDKTVLVTAHTDLYFIYVLFLYFSGTA